MNLKKLFEPRNEEKEIEHDSFMIMAAFLSEIEYIQDHKKILRKELAKKIKISPSYLTQVFRGKKPLNFLTLAKIKRALNIGFEIKIYSKEEYQIPSLMNVSIYHQIQTNKFAKDFLTEKMDSIPEKGSKFFVQDGAYTSISSKSIYRDRPTLS